MAPELLNSGGLFNKKAEPTKKSDIYAFGMTMYEVSVMGRISTREFNGSLQVIAGKQPFAGKRDGEIIYFTVHGDRPTKPEGTAEVLPDDLWGLICRCWSPKPESRPDAVVIIGAMKKAADLEKKRRKKVYLDEERRKLLSDKQSASCRYRSLNQAELS